MSIGCPFYIVSPAKKTRFRCQPGGKEASVHVCRLSKTKRKHFINPNRHIIYSLGDDQNNITQLLSLFPQNQNNKKSLGYNPNATVTMGELKKFLLHNQFITKSELMSSLDKFALTLPSRKTNALFDSTFDEVPIVMKKKKWQQIY